MIEIAIIAGVALICAAAAYIFRLRIESQERMHERTVNKAASDKIAVISAHVDEQLAAIRTDVTKLSMHAGFRPGGR